MFRRLSLLFGFVCLLLSPGVAVSQSQPVLEICVAQTEPAEGLREMQVQDGTAIYVDSTPVIREDDIESVEVKDDGSSGKNILDAPARS